MRVIAAYMLAVLSGNNSPDAATINKILDSVGIKAEADRVNKLVADLKGKNIDELIAAGNAKLSALGPVGGGAGAAPAAGGDKKEEAKGGKKEEKKEEKPKEESDGDMGLAGGLFD